MTYLLLILIALKDCYSGLIRELKGAGRLLTGLNFAIGYVYQSLKLPRPLPT